MASSNVNLPHSDAGQLLAAVPTDQLIGNGALMRKLGWTDDRYWSVRNDLIAQGFLVKGRGRGGSVRRVPPVVLESASPGPSDARLRSPESDLYQAMLETIKSQWVQDYGANSAVAEVTAHQGRRETGGKWSRPDITLATYSTFPFVPGKHFDVTTFEVKMHDALDVTAVYEALAHQRAAHYAYVLVQVPKSSDLSMETTVEYISEVASQHGIGLVVVVDPRNYETWEWRAEAERNDPDPGDLNEFIATQTGEAFKRELTHWFR